MTVVSDSLVIPKVIKDLPIIEQVLSMERIVAIQATNCARMDFS